MEVLALDEMVKETMSLDGKETVTYSDDGPKKQEAEFLHGARNHYHWKVQRPSNCEYCFKKQNQPCSVEVNDSSYYVSSNCCLRK